MRRIILWALAVLILTAAIAWAVPLSPTLEISPGPVRQNTTWHIFGGFGGVDNTPVTITISDSAAWYPVTNGTDNLWVNLDNNAIAFVKDNVVIAHKGSYVGVATITFTGNNGHDIFFRAFDVTDNVITGRSVGGTVTGASNFTPVSIPLYFEADSPNHVYRFEVRNISSGANVTIRSGIFELHYLHE